MDELRGETGSLDQFKKTWDDCHRITSVEQKLRRAPTDSEATHELGVR